MRYWPNFCGSQQNLRRQDFTLQRYSPAPKRKVCSASLEWHSSGTTRIEGACRLAKITPDGVSFPSLVLTYQAAVEGVGVSIGQLFLLRNELQDGTLVPLFNAPFERPMAHYVAWPKHQPLGRKARSFIHWLKSQIADFLADRPQISIDLKRNFREAPRIR